MKKIIACFIALASTSALAHPMFVTDELTAGKAFKADMMVTHGCGNSPTVRLVVEIPEDVLAITPQVKDGWKIQTFESELSEPRTMWGMKRTKYTSRIEWSGNTLDSDFFDVFSFIVIPPNEAGILHFPSTQHCEEGVDAYTDVPAADGSTEHVENPAPALTVNPAHDKAGH